jgi:hypothetical protein
MMEQSQRGARDMTTTWPNQGAAANSRPALRFTMMENLNIYIASDALFPAVAELDRSA